MKKRLSLLFLIGLTMNSLSLVSYAAEEAASDVPVLTIESSLSGSAYTNGKSTLKYHLNTNVTYDDASKAIFSLTMPDGSSIEDEKIDTSNASVQLIKGDGYYPSEYQLQATELDGTWENGEYTYILSEGDFEVDRSQYPLEDLDSGREWSCLGGDGAGNYHFTLEVSGITYDGQEIAAQSFPLDISIYGYDYSDDAVNLYGEEGTKPPEITFSSLESKTDSAPSDNSEPVFTWIGDGDKPILCDSLVDYFYITWDDAQDASTITSSDITLTLSNQYRDTLTLIPDQDFFVQSDAGETQIALTYQNFFFTPVYTTLTIDICNDAAAASQAFDIASVYVYEAQQGGGGQTINGTVTAYSFYGLSNLTSWEQLMSPAVYLLSYEKDGITQYYAEDENGAARLIDDPTLAYLFDASTEEFRNQKLIGNTLYITTQTALKKIEKTVGNESITFTQLYPGRDFDVDGGGKLLSPIECDQTLTPEPGYAIPWGTENWITNEKGAWQKGIETGWTGLSVTPYSGRFEWEVEKGASQQFEAALDSENVKVTWSIVGNVDKGTAVSESGLLTISENESHASFAVTAADENGILGSVSVKVI